MTSKVAGSIKDALQKQLDYVKFCREKDGPEVINAPLTNLGCGGNFATFGNDCKKAGGSVKVQTVSDKNVIAKNKLYENEVWVGKTEEERRDEFQWARKSAEAKAVRKLEKHFQRKVDAVAELKKKIDKNKKIFENLELCKKHNRHLTRPTLHMLDSLSDDQIMAEAK